MTISDLATDISSLSDSVREHIDTHRHQSVLLNDSQTWNQICSSLDAIDDSLCAVEAYGADKFPDDIGLKYIYTYGILQALFLMQDALRHLSEAFKINYEPTETLKEIREARNASIGHPTKQNVKGKLCYNFISRMTISKSGFDLLQSTEDGEHRYTAVDIIQACEDQLESVIKAYRKIVQSLAQIDRMHKEKFNGIRLADIFPSTSGYLFEKIRQAIYSHSYGDRKIGQECVGLVKDTYEKFNQALTERNELSEYTAFDLVEYFHALDRLDKYLSGRETSMKEADARIYLCYLRNEHERFERIAKEIDEDYDKATGSRLEPTVF